MDRECGLSIPDLLPQSNARCKNKAGKLVANPGIARRANLSASFCIPDAKSYV
jgi:hypothetical protein